MRYRKNKGRIKQKARMRYRQVRKNPRFKRKKQIYRKNPRRWKRLGADEQLPITAAIEFVMKCGGEIKAGYITGVVAETWQIEYRLEDGETGSLGVDRFFDCVVLFDDQDIDELFDVLDEASQVQDDGDDDLTVFEFADPTPEGTDEMLANVTNLYLAFNKENAPDLIQQLVKVLDKASSAAEGKGKKGLQDASSRVKGMAKTVARAWEQRNEA